MSLPAEAAPLESKKVPLEIPERLDTFKEWRDAQHIPIFRGFYIEDVNTLPLEYWDLKGIPACFVQLDGSGGMNDSYVCEIPPAGKTKPLRHMYEEMVYVTKGHGTTTVWQKNGGKHSFEWGPGALFAIPLNAYYQHFNSSGLEGTRFYAVTNSAFIMNLFHSIDFVFDNDFAFIDRFDPDKPDYFGGEEKLQGRLFMTTNFVPDTHTMKLFDYSERGKGEPTSSSISPANRWAPMSRNFRSAPTRESTVTAPTPTSSSSTAEAFPLCGPKAASRIASIGGRIPSSCHRINGGTSISTPARHARATSPCTEAIGGTNQCSRARAISRGASPA